jgi:hypothetical protein
MRTRRGHQFPGTASSYSSRPRSWCLWSSSSAARLATSTWPASQIRPALPGGGRLGVSQPLRPILRPFPTLGLRPTLRQHRQGTDGRAARAGSMVSSRRGRTDTAATPRRACHRGPRLRQASNTSANCDSALPSRRERRRQAGRPARRRRGRGRGRPVPGRRRRGDRPVCAQYRGWVGKDEVISAWPLARLRRLRPCPSPRRLTVLGAKGESFDPSFASLGGLGGSDASEVSHFRPFIIGLQRLKSNRGGDIDVRPSTSIDVHFLRAVRRNLSFGSGVVGRMRSGSVGAATREPGECGE